jgi:hypothetical protein
MPDDLPHAADMGNLSQVKRWFDQSGAPALGDLDNHFPCNSALARKYDDLQWGAPTAQQVLDTALLCTDHRRWLTDLGAPPGDRCASRAGMAANWQPVQS